MFAFNLMASLQRLSGDKPIAGQGKVIIHRKAATTKKAAKFGKSGSHEIKKILTERNRSLPVLLKMKQSEHITCLKGSTGNCMCTSSSSK